MTPHFGVMEQTPNGISVGPMIADAAIHMTWLTLAIRCPLDQPWPRLIMWPEKVPPIDTTSMQHTPKYIQVRKTIGSTSSELRVGGWSNEGCYD